MDATIICQIIETSGFIILGLMAAIVYLKLGKTKNNIDREISLLKDIVFYRKLIELYKFDKGTKNMYNKYREEVRKKLGYETTRLSTPAEIRKRLMVLTKRDEEVEALLEKIKDKI